MVHKMLNQTAGYGHVEYGEEGHIQGMKLWGDGWDSPNGGEPNGTYDGLKGDPKLYDGGHMLYTPVTELTGAKLIKPLQFPV